MCCLPAAQQRILGSSLYGFVPRATYIKDIVTCIHGVVQHSLAELISSHLQGNIAAAKQAILTFVDRHPYIVSLRDHFLTEARLQLQPHGLITQPCLPVHAEKEHNTDISLPRRAGVEKKSTKKWPQLGQHIRRKRQAQRMAYTTPQTSQDR